MNTTDIIETAPEAAPIALPPNPINPVNPPAPPAPPLTPQSQGTEKPIGPAAAPSVNAVLGVADTLSDSEQVDFQACEAAIQTGSFAFVEVGLALARIRDGRLYRNDFTSFEAYYHARWEMQHAKVYYMIAAAQVFTSLSTLTDVPKPGNESQLRPLLPLTADDAQLAWQYATVHCGGRTMTTRRVEHAVKELHLNAKNSSEPVTRPLRRNIVQQRRLMNDAVGELLLLLSQKADHGVLTQKVEALHRLMQACFAR